MKLALPRGVNERWFYPALALLLAIPALAPLTYPGTFQTHNGLNPVYNLISLSAQLASPGWAPAFGRGPDLLRGDGPAPYAFAAFLHLTGLSFTDAIKGAYLVAFVISALGMFLLAQRAFHSNAAGVLASVVYTYFPYHLAVVYTRGAFGEAAAWALFPLAILAYATPRGARTTPAGHFSTVLIFALLVLTQSGMALLFALGVVFTFQLYDRLTGKSGSRSEWAVGLGLVLGLLGWLPSVISHGVGGPGIAFVPAFVYPFQFFTATWGGALPKGSFLDSFPFQIGFGTLGLTILGLALAYVGRDSISSRDIQPDAAPGSRAKVALLVVLAAILLFVMMPFAAPLWELTGSTRLVEYPFQLLVFVALLLALAGSSVAVADRRFAGASLLAVLVAVPLLASYAYLSPEFLDLQPVRPPLAMFDEGKLGLLDAQIIRPVGTLRHGASVDVELQWQAFSQVNQDYTVFVHAVDESGKTWGSEDSKPQGGNLPTLKWAVGRVISDTHSLQIDLAGPPEGYRLEVGLYTAATGERAVTDTGATQAWISGEALK